MGKTYKLSKNGQTIHPATTTDAVVHPSLKVSVSKLIGEINVSNLFPTGGTNGTNKYTLESAIAKIPTDLRIVGLKCSFWDDAVELESWEYKGGTFTNTSSWRECGGRKITELEGRIAEEFTSDNENIILNADIIDNKGIDSTGNIITANWGLAYIPVTQGYYSVKLGDNITYKSSTYGKIGFAGENQELLLSVDWENQQEKDGYIVVEVQSSISYMLINTKISNLDIEDIVVSKGDTLTDFPFLVNSINKLGADFLADEYLREDYKKTKINLLNLQEDSKNFIRKELIIYDGNVNIFNSAVIYENKLINNYMQIQSANGYGYASIPVKGNTKYYYRNEFYNNYYKISGVEYPLIFKDTKGAILNAITNSSVYNGNKNTWDEIPFADDKLGKIITTPDECVTIEFNIYTDKFVKSDNIVVCEGNSFNNSELNSIANININSGRTEINKVGTQNLNDIAEKVQGLIYGGDSTFRYQNQYNRFAKVVIDEEQEYYYKPLSFNTTDWALMFVDTNMNPLRLYSTNKGTATIEDFIEWNNTKDAIDGGKIVIAPAGAVFAVFNVQTSQNNASDTIFARGDTYEVEKIENIDNSKVLPFNYIDKNVVFIADSITYFSNDTGYFTWMLKKLQFKHYLKLARSGATWRNFSDTTYNPNVASDSGHDNVAWNQFNDLKEKISKGIFPVPDCIVFLLGTNDFSTDFGDIDDTFAIENITEKPVTEMTNVYKAMRYLINLIFVEWNQCQVIICTPIYGSYASYADIKAKGEQMEQIANRLGCICIRQDKEIFINEDNASTMLRDGTHPSAIGAELYGDIMATLLPSKIKH